MDSELSTALKAREAAAADLEAAAHALTRASAAFSCASAAVLAVIPTIAADVGARAQTRHASQWQTPAGPDTEAAQRRHGAIAAGRGAAGAAEFRLTQAFSNGLRNGSAAETLGLELSQSAAAFLHAS